MSWRDEGDKTYPIAPEVRYVPWNQPLQASKDLLFIDQSDESPAVLTTGTRRRVE